MTELEQYYNKFNEEKRLQSRHGQVEYHTTMHYIHRYLDRLQEEQKNWMKQKGGAAIPSGAAILHKETRQRVESDRHVEHTPLHIIDIGAGTGRYSVALAEEGYDVTAVELVKYNLGILKQKGANVKAYQGNALKLKRFADNSFDLALLFGPMYHLHSDEEHVQALAEEQGSMPAYCFKAEKTRIAITKNGGYLSYLTNGREIGTAALESKDAPQKAKEFLQKLGLGNFQSSYYFTDEGICTVNFCYKQGNILCYTDLIKIGVALDNGQIVSCEARGFIMNHKARTVQAAKLTAAQAQAVLSKKLQPVSTNWCLIPSEGKEELYCYEFYCRGQKGEDVLVYINAQTGAEEQLLILLKTDGGTLTR